MRDGLNVWERRQVRLLEERQQKLAGLLDTELVRTLLHHEIEKIKTAARARQGLPGASLGSAVAL